MNEKGENHLLESWRTDCCISSVCFRCILMIMTDSYDGLFPLPLLSTFCVWQLFNFLKLPDVSKSSERTLLHLRGGVVKLLMTADLELCSLFPNGAGIFGWIGGDFRSVSLSPFVASRSVTNGGKSGFKPETSCITNCWIGGGGLVRPFMVWW